MSKQVQKVCNAISTAAVVLVVILALLLVGVRLVGLRPMCVLSGSVVNKVVYVENVGTGAFYTRVKITPEILNADSERMPLDPSEHLLVLDLNDTDWIAGADGYYYYNGAVDPKQLFSRVTFSTKMGNEYQNSTVHIYVTAEAVQTANLEQYAANDVRDVWKHVGAVEASTSSTQIDPIPTP